jgi:hypothetical protein
MSTIMRSVLLTNQPVEIRLLSMLNGVWSSPGALRPASFPWRAARGTRHAADITG